jgi:hypothetical protein
VTVAVSADDRGGLGRRAEAEAEAADFNQQLGGRQRLIGPDGVLDDGEQLALKRSMMPLRALPKALNHVVWGILD